MRVMEGFKNKCTFDVFYQHNLFLLRNEWYDSGAVYIKSNLVTTNERVEFKRFS